MTEVKERARAITHPVYGNVFEHIHPNFGVYSSMGEVGYTYRGMSFYYDLHNQVVGVDVNKATFTVEETANGQRFIYNDIREALEPFHGDFADKHLQAANGQVIFKRDGTVGPRLELKSCETIEIPTSFTLGVGLRFPDPAALLLIIQKMNSYDHEDIDGRFPDCTAVNVPFLLVNEPTKIGE